ncbi:YdcF family protein [Winogradskyella schleiferi]|uniref:YdcF family protein n=1 Tax=Winogradskyella schleiferi TaxID=2686078 RepID=UPI0015BF7272|nr:ElyC/SanA/YdcF family protein [Winogradskyella schleiferi]
MKAIKLIYTTVFSLFFLGCSSDSNGNSGNSDDDGQEVQNTVITLSEFNRNYSFLESNSIVKDRNFYWATLIENNVTIKNFIKNNEALSAYLETSKQRLSNIANQNNPTAAQYANALKFSNNEVIAISTAVKDVAATNANVFIDFSNTHIGPSGAFNQFKEITNVDRLQQLILEEMLKGINQIIDTYAAGIDPTYPDLDGVSYDVNSAQYKLLLRNLVTDLYANTDQMELFYQPFLNFALGVMEINNRDEAGRFMPLKLGENAAAYQNIQTINWDDYQYSMIVVLGDAPNSSGDLPNISIGGMQRSDHGVDLLNQGLAPLIVFTGANVAPFQSEYHEAIEMKNYIMDNYNISESKILVDPHARHTTTNMRNVGRFIYKYGIPHDKKAIVSTATSQSSYVSSSVFLTRCTNQMNHIPMTLHNRLSDFDIEFTPNIEVLHLDSSDPLDP